MASTKVKLRDFKLLKSTLQVGTLLKNVLRFFISERGLLRAGLINLQMKKQKRVFLKLAFLKHQQPYRLLVQPTDFFITDLR